jgi:DNA-binding MarR family transcriptional regulator
MRLLWSLDHALQKRSKWMAKSRGATGPQRLALRIIGQKGSLSAGALAEMLKVHPSTLTGILRRLETGGLIARRGDPDDRRRLVLTLTRRGLALSRVASGSVEETVAEVLARTAPGNLDAASRLLRSLVEALETGTETGRGGVPPGPR